MNKKKSGDFLVNIFLKENKGLANIVVMLIMIVLVLVAIGIIWTAIRGTIQSGSEQIQLSSKCLDVSIQSTKLVCGGASNDVCNATVSRSAGGDEIAGIKLVFSNAAADGNKIIDVPGNIAPLEVKTVSDVNTGITNTSSVEIVPYFKDSSGNEQLCSIKS